MMNPLLKDSTLPFEAIDFKSFSEEDYLPALDEAIVIAHKKFDEIKGTSDLTFDSIIVAGESANDHLDRVVEIFYPLYSAHCTDGIARIAEEFNTKLTKFNSDISLDIELFAQIKELYDKKDSLGLNTEQMTVLKKSYKSFVRNGALLNEEEKEILRDIDQKLSTLNLNFSENVRNATNEFVLFIEDEKDLVDMPEGVIEAAKETAREKGEEGKWAFTLQYPSYVPFMKYCTNRELRKKIWTASATRATDGQYANQENIKEMLKLKQKRAKLLGYNDFPEFVLEKRMASSKEEVLSFLEGICDKAMPKAKEEYAELKAFKHELTGDDDFRVYDSAFYTEKYKKKMLDFDEEEFRPYFKLENVLNGIFIVVNKLYGLKFVEKTDLPAYANDIVVYEVQDADGSYIGLFYGDYFPRKEKRPGAWMTAFRTGGYQFGEVKRPFIMNVCNFTKPTATKPSLLTLNEVRTLFHEFGHGLHGLLTKTKYKSVSGTSVHWDFVELPSQIMENWLTEKECLDLFAVHYETGEKLSNEQIEKIKKSSQFLEGMATIRQLSFGFLDMSWHTTDPESIKDVAAFEDKHMERFQLGPKEVIGNMSCSFGHIFAGGYAAGYYSYKWAEVLDADAFELFKETGLFNQETAKKFRENILEKGGSEDPMELYKKFRGRAPNPDALLRRSGLI